MTRSQRALVVCLVLLAVGVVLAIVGMLAEGNAASRVTGGVGFILVVVCGAALTATFIVIMTGWKGCIWLPLAMLVVWLGLAALNLVGLPFVLASVAVSYAAELIGIPAWLLVLAGVAAVGTLAIGVAWVVHTTHDATVKMRSRRE